MEAIAPDTLIAARPHFGRRGSDLYFFLSERPFHTLTPSEEAAWDKLQDGAVSASDLADQEATRALVRAGVVEAITPINKEKRMRVLVIEPHSDDAALSIGATMWKLREDVDFHLLTMASRSNYTTAFHLHRDYFNRSQVTAMRTAEGGLFVRHVGGQYHCSGLSEATLRYDDSDWNLDFYDRHEIPTAISNNRRAPRAVLDEWISSLGNFLHGRTFDEIWVPLGAGTHSDHDLARNAALELILKEGPRAVIRLYEDVPYGANFPEHTSRILQALDHAGATLTPWAQDVTSEFDQKLSLLTIFASQFKVPAVRSGIERSADADDGGRKVERLWTLEKLPRQIPEDELWIGTPHIREAAAELGAFLEGSGKARRLAIFAINASGRWREDLRLLSNRFPAADIVIYAAPRVRAEFAEVDQPPIELHCLDGRPISWLRAALREVGTSHRIIVAGDAVQKAKALTMLWVMGRKITCAEMDHLMQAIGSAEVCHDE